MDEYDKKIREIKLFRQPSAYLDTIFIKLVKFNLDRYPKYDFYKINNDTLFEYDLKYKCFYYSYNKIYCILRDKYKCSVQESHNLISIKAKEYLNITELSEIHYNLLIKV